MNQQPTHAGQYYLLEKIAQGGMAEIYKGLAYDLHGIKKTVVIKKILPHISANKEFVEMLISEAKIAVMLNHGNIAQIYDLGKVGDDYFIVMEYVDGKSLSQIHKRSLAHGYLIPLEHLCYCAAEVLNGLDYIHRRVDENGNNLNIIHRDISPQNIIVSYAGTVKIIDFGIAKAATMIENTESGVLKGKFAYMSPEQVMGERLDRRCDIFSLGVVMHELLTGRRLFKAEDKRETVRNVKKCEVQPPSTYRSGVPKIIDDIVMKALKKDREQRYQWASEMRADLLKFLHSNYPDYTPQRLVEFMQLLFAPELESKPTEDEEAKTPYLVIDQTQSAINVSEETTPDEASFEREGFQEEDISREDEVPLVVVGKRVWERMWAKCLAAGVVLVAVFGIVLTVQNGFWKSIYNFIVGNDGLSVEEASFVVLRVFTQPEDAQVYLDGRLAGSQSPVVIEDIEPGRAYMLRVSRDGFVPYERRLTFSSGEDSTLNIVLDRADVGAASVVVRSVPEGAVVYIDDVETSYRTPAVISNLEVGKRYKIGLYYPNYKYWAADFYAKAGRTESFDIQLGMDYGQLVVTSTPGGADVLMNGSFVGRTPLHLKEVVPGKVYKIEVMKQGYNVWKKEVKVAAGKKVEVFPVLERIRPAR